MMPLDKKEQEYLIKLGRRIVELREEKGLKQIEFSDLLDMDDGSLRRLESGRTNPTTTTLRQLARALDISLSDLFNFSE